ncbi:MAG: hypothetical protein ACJAXG_001113 [Celeribacter sp.]
MDFGEPLGVIGGMECKIHFYVMSLPHSDAVFVKGYPVETTEAFCDGHVSAFAFFGGIPQSILYDNTKIAVARILGDRTRILDLSVWRNSSVRFNPTISLHCAVNALKGAALRPYMFDYIEMFYNPSRKHTNNGMLSPVDYETKQRKMNEAGVEQTRGTFSTISAEV